MYPKECAGCLFLSKIFRYDGNPPEDVILSLSPEDRRAFLKDLRDENSWRELDCCEAIPHPLPPPEIDLAGKSGEILFPQACPNEGPITILPVNNAELMDLVDHLNAAPARQKGKIRIVFGVNEKTDNGNRPSVEVKETVEVS
ncbi:hypothetical protein HY439_01365 [Candidatus Microgenomates bacterium]|nr:hypothetical protein [Candidatus Microgenomates bacterium]